MPAPIAVAAAKVGKQIATKFAKAVVGGKKKGGKKKGLWWKLAVVAVILLGFISISIPSMLFTTAVSTLGGAGGALAADDTGVCTPDTGGVSVSPVSVKSMTPVQVKNVQAIIGAAKKRNLNTNAMIIGVMVGQVEAGLKNLAARGNGQDASQGFPNDGVAPADNQSVGLFQQQPWWGDMKTRMTPILAANTFFMGAAGLRGLTGVKGWESMPKGVAAQTVQGSAFPDRYALYEKFATQAVQLIEPSVSTTGSDPGAAPVGFVMDPPSSPSPPPQLVPGIPGAPAPGTGTPAPQTPDAPAGFLGAADPCLGQSGPGDLTAFNKTLLSYAWPDYYGNGHVAQTPGYSKAVQAAIVGGRYVGQVGGLPAGRPPGDDCGGFVTTLMHDSGWDPSYNSGGLVSKGAGGTPVQLAWLQKHWKLVGAGSELKPSDLQPGDIGISSSPSLGHVWVYTGNVPGFNGNYAASSWLGGSFIGYSPNAIKSNKVLFSEVSTVKYFRKPSTGGAGVVAAGDGKFANPMQPGSYRLVSGFGPRRSPGGIGSTNHAGQDMAAPTGTPIRAACTGTVVYAQGSLGGLGKGTVIDCGSGIRTMYGHQSAQQVSPGQKVQIGQQIGLVGSTGRSTGPHLHFQINTAVPVTGGAFSGTPVEPMGFMRGHGSPL